MCLVAVGLSRTSCIPCPCCTTPVHQLICFMMKAESVLAHGLQSRFCSQQRCTLNNCIPLLSKPMYWINFLLPYYSNWAGRGLLPGLCGQRACAMEQRSTYYQASATTNRVAFPVSIQINPGRAPVWSAMPQKVSDNPNRERSLQVLRWYSYVPICLLPPRLPADWQRESRFVLRNMSEGGMQSMFCRSGHKAEYMKQYYLLSYVSEAMTQ